MRASEFLPLALAFLLAVACSARVSSSAAAPTTTLRPGSCHYQPMTLPDPDCTPGALNPAVTQANIAVTVCQPGWTAKIRPPVRYTTPLKLNQMAAYGVARHPASDYEEDHRIPLVVGGNPTSSQNLWPEPWTGPHGAHAKDLIEVEVHREICAGTMTLTEGQALFEGTWWDYEPSARFAQLGPVTDEDDNG